MTSREAEEGIQLTNLLWLGPLTVVSSVFAVLTARYVALTVLRPSPESLLFGLGLPILLTTALVATAVLIFALAGRLARRSILTFRVVTGLVLMALIIPEAWLLPGAATAANFLALAGLHLIAFLMSATMLPWLARCKRS